MPRFVFRQGLLHTAIPSRRHLLLGRFYIWNPEHLHHSLFPSESQVTTGSSLVESFISFSRFMGLSPFDLFSLMNYGTLARYLASLLIYWFVVHIFFLFFSLKYGRNVLQVEKHIHHNHVWEHTAKPQLLIQPLSALSSPSVTSSSVLSQFVFTSTIGTGYAHLDHRLHSMTETIEHRILRSRKARNVEVPEIPFNVRPIQTISGVWTNMPHLLSLSTLKVLLVL